MLQLNRLLLVVDFAVHHLEDVHVHILAEALVMLVHIRQLVAGRVDNIEVRVCDTAAEFRCLLNKHVGLERGNADPCALRS